MPRFLVPQMVFWVSGVLGAGLELLNPPQRLWVWTASLVFWASGCWIMGKGILAKLPAQNLWVLALCLGIVPGFVIYSVETEGFAKGTFASSFLNCSSPESGWRMIWLGAYTFALISSCRFLCRALLVNQRTRPGYGYRLQAATAGLVCISLAGHAATPADQGILAGLGTRGIQLALGSLAGAALVVITLPWWLRKAPKPVPDPPEAALVWPCLQAFTAVGSLARRDWLAGGLAVVSVLAIMAIRHLARRPESPAATALAEPPSSHPPLPRAG